MSLSLITRKFTVEEYEKMTASHHSLAVNRHFWNLASIDDISNLYLIFTKSI